MIKVVTLLLLLSLAVSYDMTSADLYHSPSIPPECFVDQYYTCDFRVTGLKNPTYTFEKLPSFFKGASTGRIEGKPNRKGNYEIIVSYK